MSTEQTKVTVRCGVCRTDVEVTVNLDDFRAWKNGQHAQSAFPYLTAGERELLISGTCEPCFDTMFPED